MSFPLCMNFYSTFLSYSNLLQNAPFFYIFTKFSLFAAIAHKNAAEMQKTSECTQMSLHSLYRDFITQ